MSRHFKHRVANLLYPRYLQITDQANYNALVTKWIKDNKHLPVFDSRLAFYEYIQARYIGTDSIDYLEFGVFQGESLSQWCNLNPHAGSRFFGFDSFKGLPEDWGLCRAGTFDVKGALPDISDERLQFVAGWFQKTLSGFLKDFQPKSRLVINNDSDLYSSTLYVLAKLDSLLVKGSILIFDEFYSGLHEYRAMNDYLSAFNRKATPIARVEDPHGRVAFIFD
ncbi:MAG: TylF/MycF/NovP-related O-methyltransferase [Rhizomicrobium sp.]